MSTFSGSSATTSSLAASVSGPCTLIRAPAFTLILLLPGALLPWTTGAPCTFRVLPEEYRIAPASSARLPVMVPPVSVVVDKVPLYSAPPAAVARFEDSSPSEMVRFPML